MPPGGGCCRCALFCSAGLGRTSPCCSFGLVELGLPSSDEPPHGCPSVPGRTAAMRGAGLVSAVALSENDQPSKPPWMKARFFRPHWLYSHAQPLAACQYDQYPLAGGVSTQDSR